MERKTYTTSRATSSGPYSHAVDAGEYIFLSGQTAYNTIDAPNLEGDIAKQTEMAFDNLFDVLKEADLTPAQVVKVNVYLTSMKHFSAMNEVYGKRFEKPYPARTCVAVKELPLEADVEIEFIARR